MVENSRKIILIVGGTGLVGSALIKNIDQSKYRIYVLSRSKKLNPQKDVNFIDWTFVESKEGMKFIPEILINLSGAGIADKRWTNRRKKIIVDSRVNGNKKLEDFILKRDYQPELYISASAIGYYGNRPKEVLNEESNIGTGFLSETCLKWEYAASLVGTKCKRLVVLRLGIVMTSLGGALKKMLLSKPLRILNYFGNGNQMQSWIHIEDLCQIIIESIESKEMNGTFNAVSPEPISNKSMMKIISSSHSKKSIVLSIPTFIIKLLLGEMSAIVLDSANVSANKLTSSGYKFKFPNFKLAYKDILDKKI